MRPGAREEFIEASRQDFKVPSDPTKEQSCATRSRPAGEMKFKSKAEAVQMWCDAFARRSAKKSVRPPGARPPRCNQGQICVIGFSFDGEEPESSARSRSRGRSANPSHVLRATRHSPQGDEHAPPDLRRS